MRYSFYVTVHGLPPAATAGATLELGGRTLSVLQMAPQDLAAMTMNVSFETTVERISKLERMFCEADGSFVWVSSQGEPAWQVDGNLYDRNERLLFVDLKGTCPGDQFDRLLSAFGWPETPLVFQLTREAVFLSEAEFRRHAAVTAG